MKPGTVTLTTDFGLEGPYVGAMKGILLGLAPGLAMVDVCHSITPQNVLEGAFVLEGIVNAFPEGTVHLVVVDPGVGTDRRLLTMRIAGQWFVLPDNGLITGVARAKGIDAAWEIDNPRLARRVVTPTFHGRDILAPAAAHLLKGGDPFELGPETSKYIMLRNFEPTPTEHGCIGEVIFRDAFGNLITNIKKDQLGDRDPQEWTVEIGGRKIDGVSRTYGESVAGSLIALFGSSGWVEGAVVNGDAGRLLSAGPGTTGWLRPEFQS